MFEAGYFEYFGHAKTFNLEDTFKWDQNVVREVSINANTITVMYDNQSFSLFIAGCDPRDISTMDTAKCYNKPKGCCFKHSGCGYEKCLQHYPLQQVTFTCDTAALLHNIIIGFERNNESEDYTPYYHAFSFILNDGKKIPFLVTNSHSQYSVSVSIL